MDSESYFSAESGLVLNLPRFFSFFILKCAIPKENVLLLLCVDFNNAHDYPTLRSSRFKKRVSKENYTARKKNFNQDGFVSKPKVKKSSVASEVCPDYQAIFLTNSLSCDCRSLLQ